MPIGITYSRIHNSAALSIKLLYVMNKIKTGLAAYGMSGQVFHAPFISTNPHFELTAITERSKNLARERYPQARIVRSFDELLEVDGLELVVVNTPDSSHYEYARRALEAGKHVIVEKPFTQTVEEANELVALAAGKGLTLFIRTAVGTAIS